MAEEIKKEKAEVKSFRVTDEVVAKLKELQGPGCPTTDAVLKMLISTYELEMAKEVIPERKTEISNFQMKAKEMVDAFLFSVQLNEDAEKRIRAEFADRLETQTKTIANYQEQIEVLKGEKKALAEAAAEAKGLQADLDAVTEQARHDRNDAADRLAEKDRLISALDGEVLKYKTQAEGYDDLKADRDSLGERLREANSTIKDLQKDHQMEMERAGMAAQQAQREAVAEATATIREKLDQAKEQLAAAQAEANSLREFKAANDRLHETVGEQKAKITMLEAMLEEQTRELKASRNEGAGGQTAIEGV